MAKAIVLLLLIICAASAGAAKKCEGQCGSHNEKDSGGPCGGSSHTSGSCGVRGRRRLPACTLGAGCPWLQCSAARCDAVCSGHADGEAFKVGETTTNKGKTIRCFGYAGANATADGSSCAGAAAPLTKVKELHGIVMALSWATAATFGIFVARYFRHKVCTSTNDPSF